MSADQITPFVFDALPVRGALIHLSRSWRRMLREHQYDDIVLETLGHAAAATGLIAQSMKFEGAITLQIQGAGNLHMLVMRCHDMLRLRAERTRRKRRILRQPGCLETETSTHRHRRFPTRHSHDHH